MFGFKKIRASPRDVFPGDVASRLYREYSSTFHRLPTFGSSPLSDLARRRLFRDAREIIWRMVFAHVAESKIKGDLLAFGVYRGTSFISAFKQAQEHRLTHMRFL